MHEKMKMAKQTAENWLTKDWQKIFLKMVDSDWDYKIFSYFFIFLVIQLYRDAVYLYSTSDCEKNKKTYVGSIGKMANECHQWIRRG